MADTRVSSDVETRLSEIESDMKVVKWCIALAALAALAWFQRTYGGISG